MSHTLEKEQLEKNTTCAAVPCIVTDETGSPKHEIVAHHPQVKRTNEQGLTGKLAASLEYEKERRCSMKNSMWIVLFMVTVSTAISWAKGNH
jgi:hypothetical protein